MKHLVVVAVVAVMTGCAIAAGQGQSLQRPAKVAVYAGVGVGGIGAIECFRLVQESPELELHLVDAAGVQSGALDGMDVFLMPGGGSDREYAALGSNGVQRLDSFLRDGGGYLGLCAGCAVVLDEKSRARMIPWRWSGGVNGTLFPTIQVNEKGAAALGMKAGPVSVRYHGGPFMWPSTNVFEGVNVEQWATFDAEASLKGRVKPKTKMHGSTAIVGGTYGKGKLVASTVHPEYCIDTLSIVRGAFKYLTGRDVTFPPRKRSPQALAVGFMASDLPRVEIAEAALAIASDDHLDLIPVDVSGISLRALDHVDVLVLVSDRPAKDPVVKAGIRDFASRGGKVVGFGSGVKMLPPGGIACRDGKEAVAFVKKAAGPLDGGGRK